MRKVLEGGEGGERQAQCHRWAGQGEVKDGGALVACDSVASGDRFWRSPLATSSQVWEERMCRQNRGSALESLHSGWEQRRRGCWKESWGKSSVLSVLLVWRKKGENIFRLM